jgi:hypothetical protein
MVEASNFNRFSSGRGNDDHRIEKQIPLKNTIRSLVTEQMKMGYPPVRKIKSTLNNGFPTHFLARTFQYIREKGKKRKPHW